MIVLACGSRSWSDAAKIEQAYREHIGRSNVTLLHGGARGADQMAGAIAGRMSMHVETMPAQWSTHGRRAGYLRNIAMLDRQPDLVLAFWDGESTGTKHTIDTARARGIPTVVIE